VLIADELHRVTVPTIKAESLRDVRVQGVSAPGWRFLL
jgi:hypothetical protein